MPSPILTAEEAAAPVQGEPSERHLDAREEPECERCHGDGMDPWFDYLLPCPYCQGEQRP